MREEKVDEIKWNKVRDMLFANNENDPITMGHHKTEYDSLVLGRREQYLFIYLSYMKMVTYLILIYHSNFIIFH